ncbi:MAG: metallophosphoesterase [Clostridia bacterium]|nr:metallophosphoesterase [Clostridia bacterium]
MKTFFIADTHFGDSSIFRYENRPFASVREMDEEMIARWNAAVQNEDVVYVLGDFGADGREAETLSRLNGTKYLIKGNHDTKSNAEYRAFGFAEVYDHPILLDSFWILSHDAVYVNTNMPYANLFGHVHNSPIVKDLSAQHCCVSVERIQYTPIAFDTIKRRIKEAVEEQTKV